MDSGKKNKLFIATFFEDETLCNLAKKLGAEAGNELRVVPCEKIHITWKFIGNVDLSENEKVINIVREFSPLIKDFTLVFDKLELWSNLKHPKLFSLSASRYDEKFTEFFNNLEESLYENLKIEKDKRGLLPHITVARIKQHANKNLLKGLGKGFEPIELGIKTISLAQSTTVSTEDSSEIVYKRLYTENL